jgi:spermidine synthase
VKLLGRYQGKNGQIDIVECSWDGTRVYFEEGIRQSQATPNGESVFTYVKLMDELLSRSEQVLVLGCGGGNLATRLSRLGKRLTIVDNNPISFVLAHRYFDLQDELPCIVSDFRKFVFDDRAYYDGIAIDVGGPGFRFTEEFDAETCDATRARLAPGGRIVMNVRWQTTLIRHLTGSRPDSPVRNCGHGSSMSHSSRIAMPSSPASLRRRWVRGQRSIA